MSYWTEKLQILYYLRNIHIDNYFLADSLKIIECLFKNYVIPIYTIAICQIF